MGICMRNYLRFYGLNRLRQIKLVGDEERVPLAQLSDEQRADRTYDEALQQTSFAQFQLDSIDQSKKEVTTDEITSKERL